MEAIVSLVEDVSLVLRVIVDASGAGMLVWAAQELGFQVDLELLIEDGLVFVGTVVEADVGLAAEGYHDLSDFFGL